MHPYLTRLVGGSAAFQSMLRQVARIAGTEAPVLLEGETGTGKELVARAIHYGGPRHDRPFIPAHCGAMPDSLVENELFGHVRGAYTDARETQPGLVALACGGTLFLDEVDTLSPKGQIALLRFLQDLSYRPLGSRREEHADVRIIAASNADLAQAVANKSFRMDLFYRLQVLSLRLPPLRERQGDAPLLARHFIRAHCQRLGWPVSQLDPSSVADLNAYRWPGNVRELESMVQRELLLADSDVVSFSALARPGSVRPTSALASFQVAKALAVEQFERNYVTELLCLTHGNLSEAARLSGKERSRLGKLVRKYGLRREAFAVPNELAPRVD